MADTQTVERAIEVEQPISTVYNQWTQFEEFPRFMDGVVEVRQLDPSNLHWVADIGGSRKEWESTIVRQEPEREISWDGFGDVDQRGTVAFEPVADSRTRVHVRIDYWPEGAMEELGSRLGFVERKVEGDLERFKDFIESRGQETGAWRGRIEGGRETEGGATA